MGEPDEVRDKRERYGEQDEWGNSVADLRANLRLTPYERLVRAERHAKGLLRLKRAIKPKP